MPSTTATVIKKEAAFSLPRCLSSQSSNREGSSGSSSSSGKKGSRVHQRLDAVGQGGAEIEDTPEQRQAQGGVLILDEHPLLHLFLQPTVRLAHHNGLLLWSQHHDPLNESLSANHGLIGCSAGLLCFIWHSYTVLLN